MNKLLSVADKRDLELIERKFNTERNRIESERARIFLARKKFDEEDKELNKSEAQNNKVRDMLGQRRYGIPIPVESKKTLEQVSARLRGKHLTDALARAIEDAGNSGILEGELGHVFFGQSKSIRQVHIKKLKEQSVIREEATVKGHRYFYVQQEK